MGKEREWRCCRVVAGSRAAWALGALNVRRDAETADPMNVEAAPGAGEATLALCASAQRLD
jgi:hypothetical protein